MNETNQKSQLALEQDYLEARQANSRPLQARRRILISR